MKRDRPAVFFFIPSTHWEGAVFKTREQYLEIGLPNILRALKLLREYPSYRWTLDQVCYVRPFLERYPVEAVEFRRYVREGRLAIAGGTDVMMDGNMPGGESFVRQFQYGKGYFRKALGVDVTEGWQLDTFGHHAQMPQLLKLAGFNWFWFFRGMARWELPADFQWQGIDGTRIRSIWLPHAYANVFGSPAEAAGFAAFMQKAYDGLAAFERRPERVGMSAADVCEPEAHVPGCVEAFNRQPDAPFRIQLAVPAEFEAALARRPAPPVIGGELNPIFQGAYSSRIELKQRTRELETLLTGAEKAGAVLQGLGRKTDDSVLWNAWEPMLFNQAHDLMSGVMTDHVYDDTIRGYDFARTTAQSELDSRLRRIADQVDTRGDGKPIVVFNTMGWIRTDVAAATVGFAEVGVRGVRVTGPDGQQVPSQVLEAARHADGTLANVRILFLAADVPALGYAVYHVAPTDTADSVEGEIGGLLENRYYRLEMDPASGAMRQLTVKDGNWKALTGPGNVVAMEEDKGDFWELYRSLDAGMRIATKERHAPPKAGAATFSTKQAAEPGVVRRGPVMQEISVTHPFGKKGRFRTTVRIYADLRRIEIHTRILNQNEHVRYRVMFPSTIRKGKSVHEIPFGAIERPDGIEFPAQNWIDWSGAGKGLALLNRGLPGNNVYAGTMMLSLMRSTRIVAYGYGGGYEPGMSSDTGLELGKELGFDYALVPHGGDWRKSGIHRAGLEFNHPLMAVAADTHAGRLPRRWGFLEVAGAGVVLSSLTSSKDGSIVMRVYEATGRRAGGVRVTCAAPIRSAEEVNLLEDPIRRLKVTRGVLVLNLRPFEIRTIRLRVQPRTIR